MTTFDRTTWTVEFTVTMRLATLSDLPKLEWYGQYTHFRVIFQNTYRDQQKGKRLMLIAESNHFPIGQIFVNLDGARRDSDRSPRAYLYALRVIEMFRGVGIGTRLIAEAERIVHERGFRWVSIGVAKDNARARELYERLDYHIYRDDSGEWSYTNHEGRTCYVREPCWLLEKHLEI